MGYWNLGSSERGFRWGLFLGSSDKYLELDLADLEEMKWIGSRGEVDRL